MRCPRCSFENPTGTKFCGQCGTRLGASCPSCGTLNPEGFAFCGSCGASLTAPAPAAPAAPSGAEERKVVTIVFADLSGSTPLAEQLDPEQMRSIMARFFEAMAQVIGRYEGTVERFIGDEIKAVFGVPTVHEDDPERAVQAALAMHERLNGLNGELPASLGHALQMHIGINTGEVVVSGQVAGKDEFTVTGDAVHLAARLRSAATPGMTVVGERTYRDTVRVAEYRPLPPLALKGKALPVKAWELIGVLPEAPRRGLAGLRAPMIGREEELAVVQGLLQRVMRERKPHLITIIGSPGVGKTRLFEEIAASPPASMTLRHGRSLPYGNTSLWAVGEIVRSDCAILRSDSVPVMTQKLQQRIDDLVGDERDTGETRQITVQLARVLAARGLEADAAQESSREDLFWGLRRYLERLANRAPLMLVFEDIHWADAELLDFVEYLAQWASGAPLLILCLTRPELLETRPDWGGGKRNYTSLFLEPLAADDTGRLLHELLRTETLPVAITRAVSVAEGNPFFVEEMLRMLIDTGVLQRVDGEWEVSSVLNVTVPDTIQGVVTARLDRLGRQEKSILQDAAVLGKVFWTGALAHLTGSGEPVLASALQTLQAKDFLIERERSQLAGQREFTFKHVITRDMAYTALPKSRRSEKHRAFAVWLEQTYGERAEEFAELLAHHCLQAARLAREIGLPEQWAEVAPNAMRYALMAGRKAARVYANDQALTHFEIARALAVDLGAEPERIAAIEGLADVHALQARWEEASPLYQEALDYHKRQGDALRQARVQSRIASTFSGVFDFRQALPHIKAAMDTLQAEKGERELVSVYLQMSRTQAYLGNFREAEQFAREGLRLAEQQKLTVHIAEGHSRLAWVRALLGRADAEVYYERANKVAEESGDLGHAIPSFTAQGFYYDTRGEYTRAFEAMARALRISEDVGNRSRMALCHAWLGRLHFLTGDCGAALTSWQRHLEMSEAFPAVIEQVKSQVAFIRNEYDGALEWARKAVAHAERRRDMLWLGVALDTTAAVAVRMGRYTEARGLLDEYLPRFTQMEILWPAYLHPLAAEAALALGDVDGASEHCQRAEAYLPLGLKPAQARLLRVQGLVAAARGRPDDAIRLIQEAADLYRAIGQPYDHARCLEDLAAALERRDAGGDRGAAANAMQEALGIYQKLGAEFEVRRIQQVPAADGTSS